MARWFGSLRRQIMLAIALTVAAMTALFAWEVTRRQAAFLQTREGDKAVGLAQVLATGAANWVVARDLAGLEDLVQAVGRNPEVLYAMILDLEGRVLAHTEAQRLGQFVRDLPAPTEPVRLTQTGDLVDAASAVSLAGRPVGWARLGFSQRGIAAELAAIRAAGAGYAGVATLIGLGLAITLGRRVTRRLWAIQSVADAVEQGHGERRVPLVGVDEAAHLAQAFNRMLDTLAEREGDLRRSRDALQLTQFALDHSRDGVLWFDPAGRLTDANQRARRDLAGGPEALTGRHIWDIDANLEPADWPPLFERLRREGAMSFASALRRPDGTCFPVELSASLVPYGGREHVFALARDISERKRIEAELERHRQHLEQLVAERTRDLERARTEAERLAQVKSDFLASMSHEIRTPLNAVLGLARIGARDSQGGPAAATFEGILSYSQHLLGVINDILDFSKIEAGKLPIEPRPFRLQAAIEDAAAMVAERAAAKGLSFAVERAADLPAWVEGDPLRLQQILINLLGNAVKFTPRGQVALRVGRRDGGLEFEVTDTGIGLDPAHQERLFQPFEQLDGSRTRRFGGTGLGLAISHKLALAMGGGIQVHSDPDAGSRFCLWLPLPPVDPGVEPAAHGPRESGPRLAGMRVLAAEDVEINRLVLEDLLVEEGARVLMAEDGQRVLDLLEQAGATSFDLVLMDIEMPVLDGYQATARLRQIAPALPIIGLTAHAMPAARQRCLAAGMVDHLAKPIDPDTLVAALRRHTGRDAPPVASAPGADPPPAAAGTRIDWATLDRQYGHRAGFVDQLIDSARRVQTAELEQLWEAVRSADLAALAQIAHGIKSSTAYLRAQAAQDLALRTERAARLGEPEALALAERLAEAVQELLGELQAGRPGT